MFRKEGELRISKENEATLHDQVGSSVREVCCLLCVFLRGAGASQARRGGVVVSFVSRPPVCSIACQAVICFSRHGVIVFTYSGAVEDVFFFVKRTLPSEVKIFARRWLSATNKQKKN